MHIFANMIMDVHSHHLTEDFQSIYSFDVTQPYLSPNVGYFSAGLHPWNIEKKHIDWYIRIIERIGRHRKCIAIGECGLDYKKPHNRDLQIKVFEQQLNIASWFRLPVIIHCAGAFHDLLRIRKFSDASVPWVVHGFRQNAELARQCLDAGMYLSVGSYVLNGKHDALISFLPLDRLFIETDEWQGDVRQLYAYVAHKRGLSYDVVQEHIHTNVRLVFQKYSG